MALANLTDLFARTKAKAFAQYKTLTAFIADVGVLVAEAQELETAFWAFLSRLDLDVADGVWLDRLGKLVGEVRGPDITGGDVQFRYIIKARIYANISKATVNDLLTVGSAFRGIFVPGGPWVLKEWWPAALTIQDPTVTFSGGPMDYSLKRLLRLFRFARAIGVKLTVLYQDNLDNSLIFVCGDAGGGSPTGKGFDDAAAPGNINAGRLAGAEDA